MTTKVEADSPDELEITTVAFNRSAALRFGSIELKVGIVLSL